MVSKSSADIGHFDADGILWFKRTGDKGRSSRRR